MLTLPAFTKGTPVFNEVTTRDTGLEVALSTGAESSFFSWLWLRDHGVDSDSLDPETLQRKVNTFTIPSNLAPSTVEVDSSKTSIQIGWNDGSATTITAEVLAGVEGGYPEPHVLAPYLQKRMWNGKRPLENLPTVTFAEVMSSEYTLREWLENISTHGFSLVADVPTSDADTQALAERLGPVQETLFGRLWHLSAELADHGDSAYSTQYLEPHTDGTYYHDAPGLQMFNCQVFDGKGGESILVDGFAIAEQMQQEDPHAFDTLRRLSVPGHYLEPGVHVRAQRPVFKCDAYGNIEQVSFNNYDRAPMRLSAGDEREFYRAYRLFHRYANDQSNWLKIPLRPGTTLIFDNWRVLHGRMGYVGKRTFYGCYHSRATFESKLRVAQQVNQGS